MQTEESYTGFLTVNKELDSNLFFWYFPSRRVLVHRRNLLLPFLCLFREGCASTAQFANQALKIEL